MSASEDTQAVPKGRRRGRKRRWAAAILGGLLLLSTVLAIGARYAVLTPETRQFIEARVNGLKVGRFGRLQVEGLDGDLWSEFSLRRLAIADDLGVWVEARDLRLSWRPSEVLTRTVAIDRLAAEEVRIFRRPSLGPKTPSDGMPVTIRIGELKTRVEMLPALSYRRGLYDLVAALEIRRLNRGQKGRVSAKSLLHEGDHLEAQFDLGEKRPLLIVVDAEEAQGGALAGALGLPADQAFQMAVEARGRMSAGKFNARATSGDTTPLQAYGAWSEQGGQADGRVSLSASRLTRGLAARLGDEVDFMFYGRKTPGALYALDGRLSAANLTVTARGQGDIGERRTGPAGVSVVFDAPELSKLAGTKGLGPARIAGVLRGDGEDLRFAGQAQLAQVALGGYGLDRVTGPVELIHRAKSQTLTLKLAGQGGRGSGYLAALLGGAPEVQVEARRLDGGRLLLRELSAQGRGLKVEASGGRTLLGGLTFKGEATIDNLEAARAGAAGGLAATWSAAQARAGRPWTFRLDAQGKSMALGVSEVDRLLGTTPTLRARAELAGRQLTVSEARLVGAAAQAKTAGVLDDAGGLDFALDWTAEGPFQAGPLEIIGKAAGSGTVTGALATPRADLAADFDQIDAPNLPLVKAHLTLTFLRAADGSSGRAALTAASAYGPAKASAAFRFPAGGIDLTDLEVDAGGLKASGSVSLRRRSPSAADLDLTLTKGAFLESGKIIGSAKVVDAPGGPRASLRLAADNAMFIGRQMAIRDGRLSADGPLAKLPYAVAAEGASRRGRWRLNGDGAYTSSEGRTEITFNGSGRLGRRELKTVETARLRFGDDERGAQLRLGASDGGRLDVDARMTNGDADIKMTAVDLDLGLVNEDLAGKANATLVMRGRGESLDGDLNARLTGARGRGADPATGVDGVLRARLAGDSLSITAEGANSQGLKAEADLVLPAEASAAPFRVALDRTRPIRGRLFADGEVRPLWDLLSDGERSLSGHVRTEATLGGTLADPRAVGQAEVAEGRFTDSATGLVLRDVQLKARLADNAVEVSEARAADGHGGTVAGGGRISLSRNGVSGFRLNLKRFRLIDNDQATASATGQATIDRGADGKMRIAGDLTIDEAEIAADLPTPSGVVVMDVVERNRPVDLEATLAPVTVRGSGVALDVKLKAPRRVYLRGRGLDVEFSLDAHVGGTTSRPVLDGEARVVRGDYEFAGKRFDFDPRSVVYLATSPKGIRLNLTATRSDVSLVAVVRISGTAAKPVITLTSTPVLPSDEVLSQVLFGRSASQLSPLEAAQLASALSSLAGGGGFDVIGGLRNFAGLDRLALGGGGENAVSVSGGKYLTDDVYLELTGGGRDGASVQVEWRVRQNLSVVSKLGGQGDARLAVRWRKDY